MMRLMNVAERIAVGQNLLTIYFHLWFLFRENSERKEEEELD